MTVGTVSYIIIGCRALMTLIVIGPKLVIVS
jgi:hypothetical protein